MALRKIIAHRYTWTETDSGGITRYFTAEKGQHWDFAAGEITKGEAEGALGAADGGAVADAIVGKVITPAVSSQAAHQADVGALTSSQAAALTAVAAAGANPTKAEFDALLADVTALRTKYNAAQVDLATLRTAHNALVDALEITGGAVAAV